MKKKIFLKIVLILSLIIITWFVYSEYFKQDKSKLSKPVNPTSEFEEEATQLDNPFDAQQLMLQYQMLHLKLKHVCLLSQNIELSYFDYKYYFNIFFISFVWNKLGFLHVVLITCGLLVLHAFIVN